MKRNLVIATVTAGVLLAGGGVAAATLGSSGSGSGGSGSGSGGNTSAAGASARTDSDTAARDDDPGDSAESGESGERSDAAEHRTEQAAAQRLSASKAIAAALAHTPGRATSAELDDDNYRTLVWEVDVLGRDDVLRHVDVDPASGKVRGAHRDRDDDAASDAREARSDLRGAAVSAAEAARAGAAKGTVVSVDLDDDRGAHWGVETVSPRGDRDWVLPLTGHTLSPEPEHADD